MISKINMHEGKNLKDSMIEDEATESLDITQDEFEQSSRGTIPIKESPIFDFNN